MGRAIHVPEAAPTTGVLYVVEECAGREWVAGSKGVRVKGCRGAGVQGCRDAGVQECRGVRV